VLDILNSAVAAAARRRAEQMYEKQNPHKYTCHGCKFTSREREDFTFHLERTHKYQTEKAVAEPKRQENQE